MDSRLLDCEDVGPAEARRAEACSLLPLAYRLRNEAKRQADAIGTSERRFGTAEMRHLARLLEDLWMIADSFICDVEPRDRRDAG